jgi:nucleoid-associated protein YgaU
MRPLALLALSLALGAAEPSAIEHVVEPGESLWSIAARADVYGDPYLWPLIYKFNRDQIQNPARIYPRQRLVIPIRLDAEAREAARLEAGAASRR